MSCDENPRTSKSPTQPYTMQNNNTSDKAALDIAKFDFYFLSFSFVRSLRLHVCQ